MSGVKRATVQRKLDKALETINAQIALLEKKRAERANLGRAQYLSDKDRCASDVAGLKTEIPNEIASFVEDEVKQLLSLCHKIQADSKKALEADRQYLQLSSKADNMVSAAKREIISLQTKCQALERRISGRAGYLDDEDSEARVLRWKADDAKKQCYGASAVQDESVETMRKAHAAFLGISRSCKTYQDEYRRILSLGSDRLAAHKIAEAEKRNAYLLRDEISSISASFASINVEKFIPGQYPKSEIEQVISFVNAGQFSQALTTGRPLLASLKQLYVEAQQKQEAWLNAKKEAELAVEACQNEIAIADKELLLGFSGVPKEQIERIFNAADQLPVLIKEERFAEALETSGFILEALRKFLGDAEENKVKFQEREQIAQALMQVLYDSKYAPPEFGYSADSAGNPDRLGILHIFAKSPGGLADVKMQIDMNGDVKWEMANVPNGQEGICLETLQSVYDRVGEMGIDFRVTDLGRATGYSEEHLQDKEQVKQRERYREKK